MNCPLPEQMAMLADGTIADAARELILEHAADCVSCRREIAVASLPALAEPRSLRLTFVRAWSVAAAVLVTIAVYFLVRAPKPVDTQAKVGPVKEATQLPEPPPDVVPPGPAPIPEPEKPRPEPEPPPQPKPEPGPTPEPEKPAPPPVKPPDPAPEKPPAVVPPVKPLPQKPPSEPTREVAKAEFVEPGVLGRVAILDPVGVSLKNEALEGALLLPSDAVLTAKSAGSFRLTDGTRIQLLPGTSLGAFASDSLKCGGLRVQEGAALITPPAAGGSFYLTRNGHGVLLDGAKSAFLLSADPKSETLELSAVAGALAVQINKEKSIALAKGETLTVRKDEVDPPAKKPSAFKPLAQFKAWQDERETLLFIGFEKDDGDVLVKTGTLTANRDGQKWVAGVAGAKKKLVVQVTFSKEINASKDMTLRVRYRTTGQRLAVVPSDPDHGMPAAGSGYPVTVPQRERSATEWTTSSILIPATTGFSWYGAPQNSKRRMLSFEVDLTNVDPDKQCFDIDSIEILKK